MTLEWTKRERLKEGFKSLAACVRDFAIKGGKRP